MSENDKRNSPIEPELNKYRKMWSWLNQKSRNGEKFKKEVKLEKKSNNWSKEEKRKKSSNARKFSRLMEILMGIACFLILIFPQYYVLMLPFLLAIISLIAVKWYGGILRIAWDGKSGPPSVLFALTFPIIVSSIQIYRNIYKIYDHSEVWLKVILAAGIFLFLFLISQSQIKLFKNHSAQSFVGMLVVILLYGFTSVMLINGSAIKGEPEHYTTRVISVEKSGGKRAGGRRNITTYYLKVGPWGKNKSENKVRVSKAMYQQGFTLRDIDIYVKKGRLGISWYTVSAGNSQRLFQNQEDEKEKEKSKEVYEGADIDSEIDAFLEELEDEESDVDEIIKNLEERLDDME